jgi:hypothetical protein
MNAARRAAAGDETMSDEFEGFYSAYMSGREANGFAMFIFRKGKIVGADPMGVKFEGRYRELVTGGLEGNVTVLLPPNNTTIQGPTSGPDGISYEVKLSLASDFARQDCVRIDTPLGPVNLKLVRLRGLDV